MSDERKELGAVLLKTNGVSFICSITVDEQAFERKLLNQLDIEISSAKHFGEELIDFFADDRIADLEKSALNHFKNEFNC